MDTEVFGVRRRSSSFSLPNDLMIEIMCGLPARGILKCRLLTKSARSLLTSSSFEEAYRKRHLELNFGVLQTSVVQGKTLAYCYYDGALQEIIPGPSTATTATLTHIGTYKGMVALDESTPGSQSIIIWNPSARKQASVSLPGKPYGGYLYGLCYYDDLGWSVVLARRKGKKISSTITILHIEFKSGRIKKSEQHGVLPVCATEDEGIVVRGIPYWVNLAYYPNPTLMRFNGKEFEMIPLRSDEAGCSWLKRIYRFTWPAVR